YLNPDYFLGGKMKLNKERALDAIERLGRPLGMNGVEAAAAIYDIVNAQMLDLVRNVTVGRGYDPRQCVLFAYGGAGPLHAAEYGRQAQAIIIPSTASVHSAMGTLASDVMHVYEMSDPLVAPFNIEKFNEDFETLETTAIDGLNRLGFKGEEMAIGRYCEMRYAKQIHELRVPVPQGKLTAVDLEHLIDRFERLYEDLYGKGSAFREAGIHLETFVVEGKGKIRRPTFVKHDLNSADPSAALKTMRDVFLRKRRGFVSVPVYDFNKLGAGNVVPGPAIIETPITTILVDADQKSKVDEYLNVIVTQEA
ncbi:MAG: hydantoinase/oxoprolinase family protein, partial [Dehalococcoidia bacterium]|nr:hydantoinase/oxoprolinase family protein [Dehalococcoidia bacterium]